MHLVVPDGGDRRRARRPPMSAVGAAGGVRASGGRYGVRRREHRALELLQAGVVVGRESAPLLLPVRLGRRFPRPGQVRALARRIPVEPHRLRESAGRLRLEEKGAHHRGGVRRVLPAPDRNLRRHVQEIRLLVRRHDRQHHWPGARSRTGVAPASQVVETDNLLLAERRDAKSRELHGTLGVAALARLLGSDLLVLDRYPTATRITRASILAIATQIVGRSFDNGLRRSDNRRIASSPEKASSLDRSGSGGIAWTKSSLEGGQARAELLPFSVTRAAAHSRRARN